MEVLVSQVYTVMLSMERWLSWSKAHDWKSCVPYKGTEGSNPSLSAKKTESKRILSFFVFKKYNNKSP